MKHVLLATAALAFLCGQAMAGEVTQGPSGDPGKSSAATTSSSRSASRSASRSSASSSVTVNDAAGATGDRRGGGSRGPDIAAPPIYSANNCAVGGSVGGGSSLFAGLLGWLFESDDCKVDRRVALIKDVNGPEAASEYLCRKDMDARWAVAALNRPCADDRKAWRAAGWDPNARRE